MPSNYKALELNEALIDWFNPEQQLQRGRDAPPTRPRASFVTEFAGALPGAAPLVSTAEFAAFTPAVGDGWRSVLAPANTSWGTWDGFDEALAAAVTLPEGTALEDFKRCLAVAR